MSDVLTEGGSMGGDFAIGATIWAAECRWTSRTAQCPDCLGKLWWSVTTPAGETFDLTCGTCQRGWESSGTVDQWDFHPEAEEHRITGAEVSSVGVTAYHTERWVMLNDGDRTRPALCNFHIEPAKAFGTKEAAQAAADAMLAEIRERKLAEEAKRQGARKRKSQRKPEWWEREIRELRKQLDTARAAIAKAEGR